MRKRLRKKIEKRKRHADRASMYAYPEKGTTAWNRMQHALANRPQISWPLPCLSGTPMRQESVDKINRFMKDSRAALNGQHTKIVILDSINTEDIKE